MKPGSVEWASLQLLQPCPQCTAQSHCCSNTLSSRHIPSHGGAPWQRQLWHTCGCHLLPRVLGLCISKQTPAFTPTLHPTTLLTCRKNGNIGAPHFLWHYLWTQGEIPALPHTSDMHPWPHAPSSPAGSQVSQFPCRQLFSLFGKGGEKVGRSNIGSPYLQLRNIRAVKLISWWNFPL